MKVVHQIGAHFTDQGQIYKCLSANRAVLNPFGVSLPDPTVFRPIVREAIKQLRGLPANISAQETMLDALVHEEDPQKVVFCNSSYLSASRRILMGDQIYPDAARRCRNLANLFPDAEVEFCIALRNPATFIPAVFNRTREGKFQDFLDEIQVQHLKWSNMITKILKLVPQANLKLWCNEDSPFIWPELIRTISGCDHSVKLAGLDNYLTTIMQEEGLMRMETYLKAHPPTSEVQRRRVLSAFLEKFELDDPELDVQAPDWTDELIENLTNIYEEDIFALENMPQVEFITP